MSKDMSPRNRPNFNTKSRLTPNGRGPAGVRPGSAPAGHAAEPAGASRPPLLHLFAPGTPTSAAADPAGFGGLLADVGQLAATLGYPGLAAGVDVAMVAAAEPVAGLWPEASIWSGTGASGTGSDVEPAVVPTAGSVVQVLAAADRSRAFTASPSPPAGLVAGA